MSTTPKDEALAKALGLIQKEFGSDSIMEMGEDNQKNTEIQFISTGCMSLDRVLGGGLPRGRIIEIFGNPSSGKSVLATFLMAQIQKSGGKAVLIDAEYSFSPSFATKIGLNVDEMLLAQPTSGEEALGIVQTLVASQAVDIIVVDSVASLVPRQELEAGIGDSQMALQARMLSKGLRMLASTISKSKTIVIFINQVRTKVGVFFGNPNVTPGGSALKFWASVRLEIKKGKSITENEVVVGNWIGVNAVKNKVAPPFKTCEIELLYEKGLDLTGDLIDSAVIKEVLTKKGNVIYFGEIKLGNGREQAKEYLLYPANKALYKDIYKQLTINKQ